MIKRLLIVILLAVTAYMLYPMALLAPQSNLGAAASHVSTRGADELGSANLVTSVVVSYRGLDTLGEVTVLFLATAAVGLVLARRKEEGGHPPNEKPRAGSEFLQTGTRFLWPMILVLGLYVVVHGHLSPGGGFQGGVILATAFLLYMLAFPGSKLPDGLRHALESLSGLAYVGVALAGLILAGHFLDTRFLPAGTLGRLLSAGAIPLISLAIGLKVGAEMVTILGSLRKEDA